MSENNLPENLPDNLDDISKEDLVEIINQHIFAMPWQYDTGENRPYRDADGFRASSTTDKDDPSRTRKVLQQESWEKFLRNPQVNTSLRGIIGRLVGYGFEITSDIQEIQEAIEEVELDPRNRLYNYWPKYVGRSFIEGELFLCLTCHNDGFIEVDFIDPAALESGENEFGIIFHPKKTTMPLIYCIRDDHDPDNIIEEQIPSIFIARYPELMQVAEKQRGFNKGLLKNSRSRRKRFSTMGGFYRFVVGWDKTFITKRNIGHTRTILGWLNMYENLKEYEIDHKKSAGAYLWHVKFDDTRAWLQWLKLSDADRAKTGIAAKKTPGSTMVTGPGMDMKAINPNLPNISDSDTDILQMVTSGLNEPEDVTTGRSKAPFASVKASRGPMSDRTSDEIAYFGRFLRYDFWGAIFFLKSRINNFPEFFQVKQAVDFENQKPVFKKLKRRPEQLIEINFPMSEINDAQARARAYYGVKHPALSDVAGVPNSKLIEKLGFGNYRKLRLLFETEKEKYPELILPMDQESWQESTEAEPSRDKKIKSAKKGEK